MLRMRLWSQFWHERDLVLLILLLLQEKISGTSWICLRTDGLEQTARPKSGSSGQTENGDLFTCGHFHGDWPSDWRWSLMLQVRWEISYHLVLREMDHLLPWFGIVILVWKFLLVFPSWAFFFFFTTFCKTKAF